MKKGLFVPVFVLLISVLLLSGCGALGIAKQDELATANSKIEALEKQVAILSTINAYNVWYDQFYARGTYQFADVTSFNEKLGTLVSANGEGPASESWQKYLAADKALSDLIATLPQDTTTWDKDQYDSWYKASSDRYAGLGEVGTALFKSISQ